MATKHHHSAGAILPLTDGGTAHSSTKFEQEIHVDPVTSKPLNAVTSLESLLTVLDGKLNRHVVSIVPFSDGSGVTIYHDSKPVYTIEWSN